jgi:hypothetical protein
VLAGLGRGRNVGRGEERRFSNGRNFLLNIESKEGSRGVCEMQLIMMNVSEKKAIAKRKRRAAW